MTPQERKTKLAELAEEIRSLADKDELETAEETRFDEAEGEFTSLKAEDDKYEARMAVAEEARKVPEYVKPGDQSEDKTEGPTLLRRVEDPYQARSMSDTKEEIRSRALKAAETAKVPDWSASGIRLKDDEVREKMETLIRGGSADDDLDDEDGGTAVADYFIATGRPQYRRAFRKYMRGAALGLTEEERAAVMEVNATRIRAEASADMPGMNKNVESYRAALSTTGANGGFLIPFFLDPTVILTNAGTVNPFRRISRVETIPTNVWHGVTSAGVTAEWSSEASEVTDASPTFAQPTVTPIRADAYVQASFEVTQDSNIASQIGMLFADAKDRLEGTAFATGTGSTQPKGIVTVLQAVTASRVAANTNGAFGAVDNFALVNNLPARWQDNCDWVGHWFTANLIRQQVVVTNPTAVAGGQWVDYGPGIPSTLLGRPFYLSSAMLNAAGGIGLSSATASSDDILILGDFSQYLIVDRIGMEVVYNPLVIGSNRRPTGEVGWAAFWRVGADTTNADAFRMLRV